MAKLPSVVSPVPQDVKAFINEVRQALDGRNGDKLLTVNDLVSSGIAASGPGNTITPPPGLVGTPATPRNVQASGAIQNIIVTWDDPLYNGHSHAEIWGSSTNDLGAAVQLGMAPGAIFVDSVGPSVTRYYWVRFVNVLGVVGAFNAVAGVQGVTGSDVAYLLATLAGQITESELYNDLNGRIDEIDGGPSGTTGLLSKYTVKVDLAGHVAGYGIAATANNGTPTSSFGVRADQFWIAPPSTVSATAPTTDLYVGYVWIDSSVTPNITRYYNGTTFQTTQVKGAIPFVVQTSPTTVNGVAVPAGVYIDAAYIKNGTITTAKIGNAQIDDAKIVSLTAAKITAGEISVGNYIQSSGFISGSQGWRIHGNGVAEFAAASIRGLVTAAQIDSRGLSIKDASGNIILAAGSPLATANISGLGTLATQSTVSTGQVTGLGALATQSTVSTGQVTGLGTLATSNSVNWNTQIVNIPAFGGFAYISSITSANISTYIAGAAIGTAYISDLNATKLTSGSISVGTTISGNYSPGSTGWYIDGSGNAEFNQITVRSGQVTGALLKATAVPLFYSGVSYVINSGVSSDPNAIYLRYVVGGTNVYVPHIAVWTGTVPAPETASHRIVGSVSAGALNNSGGTSKDFSVMLVVPYAVAYETFVDQGGNTITARVIQFGSEIIANQGVSGPFSFSTSVIGSTANTYSTAQAAAILVSGNNANNTVGNVGGLFWGVR